MVRAVRWAGFGALVVVLLAGCAQEAAEGTGARFPAETATTVAPTTMTVDVDDRDGAGDDPEPAEPPSPEPTEPPAPAGTRSNPVPLGTVVVVGDWELTVESVEPDATERVLAENQFNEGPAEGRQFLMFRIVATYVGDDSGSPWDLSWAVVGNAGNTFGTAMSDYCGVVPEAFDDNGETFPGGTIAGHHCVSVPSEQIEGATIRVETLFSLTDADRTFFALQ